MAGNYVVEDHIELSQAGLPLEDNHNLPASPQASALSHTDDVFPDGGYGWVIVAACSTLSFYYVGIAYSWGVFQARLVSENVSSDSTLAFIGSTTVSFVPFGALLNGRIIRRIGTRNSAVLGSASISLGLMLNGWASKSVAGLVITNGLILGFGVGMTFMTCGTLPAQYFSRRRGIANGFVMAGGGFGGGVLSIAIQALLDRVGVPWTFRILGFINLGTAIPAALLLKERTRRSTSSFDWSLFRDPKFLLLAIGSGIATFPLLVPPFFIPLYSSSIGINAGLASILLAVFNLASACGRIGFGILADYVGPTNSLTLSMLVSAMSMLAIWPVSSSLTPFCIFIIINGLGQGGFFSSIPSVVGHIYGPTRVPVALAMTVTAWAAGYMLGAPIAGYILQSYGGSEAGPAAFRPAMYYAGTMSLAGVSLTMAIRHLMTGRLFAFV